MQIRWLLGLAVCGLMGAPVWAARLALAVSPPLVDETIAAGAPREVTVTIANSGDTALAGEIELQDLQLDRAGNPVLVPVGSSAWSAKDWVTGAEGRFSLQPGERQMLTVRLAAPTGATGGRYGVLLVTAAEADRGRTVRLQMQGGTVLMLRAGKTGRTQATVADFAAVPDGAGGLALRAGLENTGTVHLRATGEVLIREQDGRIAARLPMAGGTGTVLPGGTRDYAATWTGRTLKPGHYRGEVRFSVPGMRIVSATYDLEVPEGSHDGAAGATDGAGHAAAI